MNHNEVSGAIIDTGIHVHQRLGPGLLESAYESVLAYELRNRGLSVETQVPIPVHWDKLEIEVGFRADMVVEDMVIVELKSLENVADVHKKQLLTYLKVSGKKLGLLINFGAPLFKEGLTRIVNGLAE